MDEGLSERVRAALTDARASVDRSEVLVAALQQLRDRRALIRRCAWCGRYAIADVWLRRSELPRFVYVERLIASPGVTDGICPDCTARIS